MWLYLQRALIDGLRVLLPGYIVGGLAILSMLVVLTAYEEYGAWGAYTAIPLLAWAAVSLCVLAVVVLKWLIMGEVRPVVVPLWSRYVWRNELVNGLYECLMAPLVTNFFGTPIAPMLLRLLGCRIGRYCYIETALFSEFDLVEIGDHVALNAGAAARQAALRQDTGLELRSGAVPAPPQPRKAGRSPRGRHELACSGDISAEGCFPVTA